MSNQRTGEIFSVAAQESKTGNALTKPTDRATQGRLVILREGAYCCEAGVCMPEAQDLARAMNAGEVEWANH